MDKKCGKCGQIKLIGNFYLRRVGERKGEVYEKCKMCMKARGVEYYHKNRDRQLKLAIIRKSKAYKLKRDFINRVKDTECEDCGIKYPHYVMDFDHRGQKLINVATMIGRNWSMEKIKNEIAKCDVVCANCHRIRTFGKHAMVAKLVTAGL